MAEPELVTASADAVVQSATSTVPSGAAPSKLFDDFSHEGLRVLLRCPG
ncbi:hypothetical protein ACFQ51_51860 [Streptomyces kaempferi]